MNSVEHGGEEQGKGKEGQAMVIPRFEVMKAVYCYFFPEVRKILHEVERAIPDEMYLVTTPAEKVNELILPLFRTPFSFPQTSEGNIDLDNMHVPAIGRILDAYAGVTPGLSDFRFQYPSSGSSEAIFHLLAGLRTRGEKRIYVLPGEYEGYDIQAKNLGLEVVVADFDEAKEKGTWFISNPSARDGNIIENERISSLLDAGNHAILDLAYVGSTRPHVFDMHHPNIDAVVMSFSKPYGVFRFRVGGFCFSRSEVPTLYGNKWFKDVTRILQAVKIAEDIGPDGLHRKYGAVQEMIVGSLRTAYDIPFRKSDALLLSYLTKEDASLLSPEQKSIILPFQREDVFRFCLTPYFEKL